jgi:hypothetical protein
VVALGVLGRGRERRVVSVAARPDAPADHVVASTPAVAIPQIDEKGDRVLIELVEAVAVVSEPSSPVRICAPRRRLGDEAAAGIARDLRVAFEVVAQALPAVRGLEQDERGRTPGARCRR